MLVSFNWLKEFVEIDQSPEEVAELLTMGGVEVEGVTHVGAGLDNVFTAKIVEITPHPSSEKLRLARLSLGDRQETVVCGAPNIRVGQVVPYAGPGAVLPSGLEMEEREIRGVRSRGMICSEKELELGEDESGILVFDGATEVGLLLTEALPFIDDCLLETSITPNRGDCLSILGTAREVAALTGKPWKTPEVAPAEGYGDIRQEVEIEVPDADLCPRYVVRMVDGVTIGPSPFEIRLRLRRAGVRPISNVVDATNLILMECGQPLHAFDYSLLEGGRIVVRRLDPGESFMTLDGMERKLPENSLMIRDGKRSIALAGIMGGLNTEIHEGTDAVLIESACFERVNLRRTAKALGMSTEASYRFERGVDPEGTLWAAHRSAYVIQKLAGGRVLSGYIDVYPNPIERPSVSVRTSKVNSWLGTRIAEKEIPHYLERLGIRIEDQGGGTLEATPPSWRWDLEREEDMIEEVARIYGFQNIPVSTPAYRSDPDRSRRDRERTDRVTRLMNASGFTEVITMSFVSRRSALEFAAVGDEAQVLALLNPLSEDYSVMRTSLIPGLLSVMKRNVSFRSENLRLYEIGNTFSPISDEDLPREDLKLAGLATGERYPDSWHFQRGEVDIRGAIESKPEIDFYDVKGAMENLCDGLGVTGVTYVPSEERFLHRRKSSDLFVKGEKIGFMGELSPEKAREHDLTAKVQIFEILLEPLLILSRKQRLFEPLPRYPYVERDLSLIVEEKVSGEQIKQLISRSGHDIIASVILFDLYRGESIPEGCQSMAFRIRYQSENRTLTDEEVQEIHSRVVETLTREVGAAMRE
jgi:phenylalanyl-tRNA synthetase beta chain